MINNLKKNFSLRIDVNRAWDDRTALNFFSEYTFDSFDYVKNPSDPTTSSISSTSGVDECFLQNYLLSASPLCQR